VEIPTLPPSVPGLRLYRQLTSALTAAGVSIHPSVRHLRASFLNGSCRFLSDGNGEQYRAEKFVLANGGVLMGGLEVDSRGHIHEPVFDLDVHQTRPLDITDWRAFPDALHRAGVDVDDLLRPVRNGRAVENVHAAGLILAHWNPIEERSHEGVAIATASAAAGFALGRHGE
jgi:glycerol-3-phosphate dehydrogenase subunit B